MRKPCPRGLTTINKFILLDNEIRILSPIVYTSSQALFTCVDLSVYKCIFIIACSGSKLLCFSCLLHYEYRVVYLVEMYCNIFHSLHLIGRKV